MKVGMQKQSEPKDLLSEWAHERSAVVAARKRWLIAFGILLVGSAVAEYFEYHTANVVITLIFGALGTIAVALALAYAGFLAFMGWSYARFVRQKGQTRPHPLHLLTMVGLSSALAVFPAASTIQSRISQPFWIAILFIVWTNILCSCLGYLSEFWIGNRS